MVSTGVISIRRSAVSTIYQTSLHLPTPSEFSGRMPTTNSYIMPKGPIFDSLFLENSSQALIESHRGDRVRSAQRSSAELHMQCARIARHCRRWVEDE